MKTKAGRRVGPQTCKGTQNSLLNWSCLDAQGYNVERLKSPEKLKGAYKQGKPYFGKYVVVSVLPTDKNVARVGLR